MKGTTLKGNIGISTSSLILPNTIVTNEELAKKLSIPSRYIVSKTKIMERRKFESETPEQLVLKTIETLIGDEELQLLFLCRDSSKRKTISEKMHKVLSRNHIINNHSKIFEGKYNNCPGSLHALFQATQKMEENNLRNSVVIAGSYLFDHCNTLPNTAVLWGDACSGVLLKRNGIDSFLYYNQIEVSDIMIRTESKDSNNYVWMDGKAVSDFVKETVPELFNDALKKTDMNVNDLSQILFHQATPLILKDLIKILGIPENKVPINCHKYGNTAVASSLLTYHENKDKIKGPFVICSFGLHPDSEKEGMMANIGVFNRNYLI